MQDLRIGVAQFEHRDADKTYNLSRIHDLAGRAADQGARIVGFHECCVPGYTFLQSLDRGALARLAEPVPDGPTVRALVDVAKEHGVVVMAGLLEVDEDGELFNCYVAVGPGGHLTKHRKMHPFIHPAVRPGGGYTVIDLFGVRVGLLTCYDNNLVENPRITALMGAEVIFMPHVTGCLPSSMPGRGTVDRALWDRRDRDPGRLRKEFDGPKGRDWLMRWLPTRAYDNGVYVVFPNNIGWDYDTVKPGLAMLLDPYGEVLCESRTLGDDVVVGTCTPEPLAAAPGRRYLRARRPELYGPLADPRYQAGPAVTEPGWRPQWKAADSESAAEDG